MIPVDLFDFLEFIVIPEGLTLSCEGFPVPADDTNLVYRAAASFLTKTGIEKGISIKLNKNIPVAAGLGGGSSDAATTLLSLNDIWSMPLSLADLHALAIQLGADVPFFLHSKPSLAKGIGEILEPLEKWPKFWYVIVTPPLKVSTSWVYGNFKLKLTTGEYNYIINVLKKNSLNISHILENDLEEVTAASYPIIHTIKKHLMDAGAEGALMSGSGPSVFGIFQTLHRAISAKKALISKDLGDVFMVTHWERI